MLLEAPHTLLEFIEGWAALPCTSPPSEQRNTKEAAAEQYDTGRFRYRWRGSTKDALANENLLIAVVQHGPGRANASWIRRRITSHSYVEP